MQHNAIHEPEFVHDAAAAPTPNARAGASRFITLEGGDSAGKSSLAIVLADLEYRLALPVLKRGDRGHGLVFVSRRQISQTSVYSRELMQLLATMLWESGDDPVLPDTFWARLQASWFTAHSATVIGPLLDAGFDVITDGWLGKVSANLLTQGRHSAADLEVLFAPVRMPDVTVLLRVDPATAWARRCSLRPSEMDMNAGAGLTGAARMSFLDYQGRILTTLGRLAVEQRWAVLPVGAEEALEQTAHRLSTLVADFQQQPHDVRIATAEAGR